MSASADALCAHCRLPVGRRPLQRRLHGDESVFCCYGCALAFQVSRGVHEESEAAWLLIRLGVGAFLAMNIMLFSLLLYSGGLGADADRVRQAVHYVLFGLATPVVLVLGAPFLREALRAARAGRATVDTLIVLGAGAAYGYSAWATVAGAATVYFDTATMVLVLFTLGRYLEAAGRARAMRDLEPLLAPERQQARVVAEGGDALRAVAEVEPGMPVRVLPGERVPVDGRVRQGTSAVDESLMTGESRPVAKRPGDAVLAGSVNTTGALLVETVAAGAGTCWAAVGRDVAESLARATPVQQLADRVAAQFVYAVMALAVATVVFWAGRGPFAEALLNGLAVLIVACPCALGLATPMATSTGVGVALGRGLLVRSGAALERLAGARAVVLDKTGTLTAGTPVVTGYEALAGTDPRELLRRAAAVEAGSEHVLAAGVRAAARAAGLPEEPASDVRTSPGGGVTGRFRGEAVAVGTSAFLGELGWAVPASATERAAALARAGATVALVAWGAAVRGLLVIDDGLRPEAVSVVGSLRRAGLYTVLLSGDRPEAVAAVAERIGVDGWRAHCGPADKRSAVAALRREHGPVAAVGDGINDGPVLAAADVGIALGGATDLAQQAAAVVLPHGGVTALPWLLGLARRVRRTIVTNLAWAFGYNLVALALAAAGYLLPVIAAALMAGSSVLVVFNSLRLEGYGRRGDPAAREGQAGAQGRTATPLPRVDE